jgi:hypothetical protein
VGYRALGVEAPKSETERIAIKHINGLQRGFPDNKNVWIQAYRNKACIQRQGATPGTTPGAKILVAEGSQSEDMWAIEHGGG